MYFITRENQYRRLATEEEWKVIHRSFQFIETGINKALEPLLQRRILIVQWVVVEEDTRGKAWGGFVNKVEVIMRRWAPYKLMPDGQFILYADEK